MSRIPDGTSSNPGYVPPSDSEAESADPYPDGEAEAFEEQQEDRALDEFCAQAGAQACEDAAREQYYDEQSEDQGYEDQGYEDSGVGYEP